MSSSKQNPRDTSTPVPNGRPAQSRFIPREELQDFAAWRPGSFGNPDARSPHPSGKPVERRKAQPAPMPAEPPQPTEADWLDAVKNARDAGYHDGYRDGLVALEGFKQSFASQTTAQVGALVRSVGEQLDALQQEMARALATTAAALARQVLRSELALRPEAVAAVAEQAIAALLPSARHVVLRVHPDDHALIAAHSADAIAARGARLVSDPLIARGGCRIESDIGLVDATIDERWRRAVAALGSDQPWQDVAAPDTPVILSEPRDPGDA